MTLLAPFTGAMPQVEACLQDVIADQRVLSPWEATGIEIIIDGGDVYLDLHMQWNLPWHCAEYSGTARLFHSRCEA